MIRRVKGTYDVLPKDNYLWDYLIKQTYGVLNKYQYKEIRTPIFEHSEAFHRDSELSDMVTKETYNFKDRANRDITLRPEGTAGVIRSYVENKLYVEGDLQKLFYFGPNFRYERPQKGRFRQFYQLGVEAIGLTNPYVDAEVIMLCYDIVKSLNLKNISININTIGDNESRINYEKALVDYLTPFYEELSNDSKERLSKNPLRILDSKADNDKEILKNAPLPKDYLSKEASNYFLEVLNILDKEEINYQVVDTLVRGLDYYEHTVFEIEVDSNNLGSHNVLAGGGRYQNLVSEFGGPDLGGVGFAFGVERLLLMLEDNKDDIKDLKEPLVYILPLEENGVAKALEVSKHLRDNGIPTDLSFIKKSFKALLRQGLRSNAKFLIFIGEDELANNKLTIKNTITEEQVTINEDELLSKLGEL